MLAPQVLQPARVEAPAPAPALTRLDLAYAVNDASAGSSAPASQPAATGEWPSTVVIEYTYDRLYRLTEANYSTGDLYQYTYDEVGNRLSQETLLNGQSSLVAYQYDDANCLVSVDGVPYTWDANGNLLSDGVTAYSYDSANRLIALNGPAAALSYAYNDLGDRLQETTDGVTTTFTMDLNTGLTQALVAGETVYLYGNARIAQEHVTPGTGTPDTSYFLGDALGIALNQFASTHGGKLMIYSGGPEGLRTVLLTITLVRKHYRG